MCFFDTYRTRSECKPLVSYASAVTIVNLLYVSGAKVFNDKSFRDGGDRVVSFSPINNPVQLPIMIASPPLTITNHILNDMIPSNSGNGKPRKLPSLQGLFFLKNHESANFPFTNVT